jgi:hypothetical protein
MKHIIPSVDINIGEDLFIRITDVSFIPAVRGCYSAAPEDCYEDEPAECDWNSKNAKLIKTEKIFIGMSQDKKTKKYEWKEKEFPVDDSFVYEYYDAIIESIEEMKE